MKYTQAFQNIEDAIKFYKKELKGLTLHSNCNSLCVLIHKIGRLELLGEEHIKVASARDHLALLYKTKGKKYFEEAETQFLLALRVKEKFFGEQSAEVANYLDHIAKFYLQFGEHSKAEELLYRSLSKKRSLGYSQSPAVAKTLEFIAQVKRKKGQYNEAETLFQQALTILEKFPGYEDLVAQTMGHLALLYRQQEKYKEAEELYNSALSIAESLYGRDHSEVGKIVGNLAHLLQLEVRFYSVIDLSLMECIQGKV